MDVRAEPPLRSRLAPAVVALAAVLAARSLIRAGGLVVLALVVLSTVLVLAGGLLLLRLALG